MLVNLEGKNEKKKRYGERKKLALLDYRILCKKAGVMHVINTVIMVQKTHGAPSWEIMVSVVTNQEFSASCQY